MGLVTSKRMLADAQSGGYAVGAFNVENMEMVLAVIEAAEAMRSPVLLQTTPSTIRYANCGMYAAMVRAAAETASVPVALHLDHGDSIELVEAARSAGYTSIMFDGSQHPLDENIESTRRAVLCCGKYDIPVEGELGRVGGKEDDLVAEAAGYTDPEEAEIFVRETGISFLAIGIGTSHGIYAKPPVLNIPLVSEVRQRVSVPLVLHGTSGVPDAAVRECIERGICKVNFATELRIAYTEAVRKVLADETVFDPKKYGVAGRAAVKELVCKRMELCGSVKKA